MLKGGKCFPAFLFPLLFTGNLRQLFFGIFRGAEPVIEEIRGGCMRSSDLLALGPAYRHVLLLQNLKDGIVKPRRMTKFKGKLIGKWKHLYKVFQQFSVGLQIRRRLEENGPELS